jgi:hypothetical protein
MVPLQGKRKVEDRVSPHGNSRKYLARATRNNFKNHQIYSCYDNDTDITSSSSDN